MPLPFCCRTFSKESFLLVHDNPQDFVLSKWTTNVYVYAVWSSICSIYTVSMVIYNGLESTSGVKILIWLTHWTFYCLTLRFIFTAYNSWVHVKQETTARDVRSRKTSEIAQDHTGCAQQTLLTPIQAEQKLPNGTDDNQKKHQHQPSKAEQADKLFTRHVPIKNNLSTSLATQWFLQNISNTVSFLVTILFWTLIYSGEPHTLVSVNAHVINSLLVTADILISRAPIRVHHFHMSLGYLAVYIVFSLVYWATGGTNDKGQNFIYGVLDYSGKPVTATVAICLVALLGVPFTQVLLYCLVWGRDKIHTLVKTQHFSPHGGSEGFELADIVAHNGHAVKVHE